MAIPDAHLLGCLNLTRWSETGRSQGAIKLDRSLARLQALCVDAAGPLATMMELAEQGELTAERSVTLTKLALRFVGNASVQISRERRKRAIEEMNGKLVELADKDAIYEDAPPMLFGDCFAKEAKERTNYGLWIEPPVAHNFRGLNIFRTAALKVSAEGAA